jgi:hypothetical protein
MVGRITLHVIIYDDYNDDDDDDNNNNNNNSNNFKVLTECGAWILQWC